MSSFPEYFSSFLKSKAPLDEKSSQEEVGQGKTHVQTSTPLSSSLEAPARLATVPSNSEMAENIYQMGRLASLKINHSRQPTKAFVIGVCGGSASGKTTVCKEIMATLKSKRVVVVSQDSFYKNLSKEERELAHAAEYNFDHPDAFDYELFEQTIENMRNGKTVKIPIYDFKTHSRLDETEIVMGCDVVIVEGILIFYTKTMRELMDMKIFVDTDADTRLVRRIKRDILERGRDLESILVQYERFVKPSFDDYILPTKKFADLVIPRGGTNTVAIAVLKTFLTNLLEQSK